MRIENDMTYEEIATHYQQKSDRLALEIVGLKLKISALQKQLKDGRKNKVSSKRRDRQAGVPKRQPVRTNRAVKDKHKRPNQRANG